MDHLESVQDVIAVDVVLEEDSVEDVVDQLEHVVDQLYAEPEH
jgi:hypothetical protein